MNTRKERQLEKLHSELVRAKRDQDRYEEDYEDLRERMQHAQEAFEFHKTQVEDLEDLIRKVEESD